MDHNPFKALQNTGTIVINVNPSKGKTDKSWKKSCAALNKFGHKAQKILARMSDRDRKAIKKITFR